MSIMITIGMIGADYSFAGEPLTKHAMQDWSNYLTLSPYFSARAAEFRMFVERLFHKSGPAALMARSSLDPQAISWA